MRAKPKPKVFRLLNGNPSGRPINTEEPEYEAGIPEKPDWLGMYAGEEWDRLTSNLNGQRVFTKNDLGILVSICLVYEQMRETLEIIRVLGRSYTIEDMGGNKHYKARPECVRFENAQREYRTLLAEIGFTPSSRTRIKVIPEAKKSSGSAQFFTS